MPEQPPDDPYTSARQQHLAFIQAAVVRMAGASSTTKGWCLTLVTAALSYALVNRSWPVAALASGAVALFGSLDAHYLREERKYRGLYDAARSGGADVYDMNASSFADSAHENYCANCSWASVLCSWSVWWFYLPAFGACVLVLIRLSCQS